MVLKPVGIKSVKKSGRLSLLSLCRGEDIEMAEFDCRSGMIIYSY